MISYTKKQDILLKIGGGVILFAMVLSLIARSWIQSANNKLLGLTGGVSFSISELISIGNVLLLATVIMGLMALVGNRKKPMLFSSAVCACIYLYTGVSSIFTLNSQLQGDAMYFLGMLFGLITALLPYICIVWFAYKNEHPEKTFSKEKALASASVVFSVISMLGNCINICRVFENYPDIINVFDIEKASIESIMQNLGGIQLLPSAFSSVFQYLGIIFIILGIKYYGKISNKDQESNDIVANDNVKDGQM